MKATSKKTSMADVNAFLNHKRMAVAGVSRDSKKFGNVIFKDLIKKGFEPIPINPNVDEIEGHKCYPNLSALPEKIEALVLVTSPAQSLLLVKEAAGQGISNIWIQQGAESPEVLDYCEEQKINCISGRCIMMFTEPVKSIHSVHRFFSKLFGFYPT
jgi:uncharacterized protein